MKILVIDDSKTIRMVVGKTLRGLGHEVEEAENGKLGLEKARAEKELGLVLVDWNMPEMNGLEFVIAIRADEDLKGIPIMMVTTESEAKNIQKALDSGANEFIMKPFTKEAIQDKMALLGIG